MICLNLGYDRDRIWIFNSGSGMKELDLACSNSSSGQKNRNKVTQISVLTGDNQNYSAGWKNILRMT